MALQGTVAVIGGGPAGLSASLSLASRGLTTILIEREETLGGHAEELACKADARCQVCGACVPAGLLRDVRSHPRIQVHTEARLCAFETLDDSFRLGWSTPQGEQSAEVAGLVLATGYQTIDLAHDRQEFGHGIVEGVTATLELEQLLRDEGPTGVPARSFAFVQCVGSRDKALGRDYCSRICCASSLRLARLLRSEIADSQVTVYYQDLQPSGRRFDALLQECDDLGVRMVRGLPSKVRRELTGTRPVVCVADTITGRAEETAYDCVVLAVGMWAQDAGSLCPGLQPAMGDDGFLSADQGPRIHAAGAALGPMGIVEAVDSGRVAAARLLADLGADAPSLSATPEETPALLRPPAPQQPLPQGAPSSALATADLDPSRCAGQVVFVMDLGAARNREGHVRAMRAAAELGPRAAFVYRHAYTAEPGLERLYASMRDAGVALYATSEPPRFEEGRVLLTDPLLPGGEPVDLPYEALVVGEDYMPNSDTLVWAEAAGLLVGRDGRLSHDNPHLGATGTERRGVYVVDPARGVLPTTGFTERAEAIAQALAQVDVQDGLAEVDSAKCTACLTCQRVCPHGAPRMEWDDERARDVSTIPAQACMSCGICVALCPAGAISLGSRAEGVRA